VELREIERIIANQLGFLMQAWESEQAKRDNR
jgi:hypothetical protein